MSNMAHFSKEIIGKDFCLNHEAGKGTTALCHILATRPKGYHMSHKVKVKTKTNIKKTITLMKKAVGVFWLKMKIYDYCDQTVEKVFGLQRLKISSNPPNKCCRLYWA